MTIDDRVASVIGNLVIKNAHLEAELDRLRQSTSGLRVLYCTDCRMFGTPIRMVAGEPCGNCNSTNTKAFEELIG